MDPFNKRKKLFLACQDYVSETNRVLLFPLRNASNRVCLMVSVDIVVWSIDEHVFVSSFGDFLF